MASFSFKYLRGNDYTGDAAVDEVVGSCAPLSPPAPPSPPSPPPNTPVLDLPNTTTLDGTACYGIGEGSRLPVGDSPYTISVSFNADSSLGWSAGLLSWGHYGTDGAVTGLQIAADNTLRSMWWDEDQDASVPTI